MQEEEKYYLSGRPRSCQYACAFIGSPVTFFSKSICPQVCRSTHSQFLGSILDSGLSRSAAIIACADRPSEPFSNDTVLYQSWRNPRWLVLQRENEAFRSSKIIPHLASIEHFLLKFFYSFVVVSCLSFFVFSYTRFNKSVRENITTVVESALQRPFHISRISRCNPITGIRLVNVRLPPTKSNPTAPIISAAYIDITFSGITRSLLFKHPLHVNVRLNHAKFLLLQRVVDGPNGMPIGDWDPGIPETKTGASFPKQLHPILATLFRYFQPGTLSIRNASVALQPADFQDYGHADEVVNVKNASADLTFPAFSVNESRALPIDMRGDFKAKVKGTPVDGGSIELQCSLNGDTFFDLEPEDVAVNLHLKGHGVQACRVASFLSLPFRADNGRCSADINMDFLYKSESLVPTMRGEATLDSVSLRFHPDPKTPELQDIQGKLRFEGKTLFLEGPAGDLGTLPMTVVGNIHLEDGYDLMGYCRAVDVNNVLDTFDVDQFVPIEGLVKGEARMTGSLEEPVISGWVESVGEKAVFDKMPLNSAHLTFDWDAIAGILRFPDINATVKGGGLLSGSGSMYFDMTKESPFDIREEQHSDRSPKAEYWNENEGRRKILPPLPSDALEIDEFAPFREYDSMRFEFAVSSVKGGDLLRFYGGDYGEIASKSVGLVNGEGIIAGHMEDANCRFFWRSVSPPPSVFLTESKPDQPLPGRDGTSSNNDKSKNIESMSTAISLPIGRKAVEQDTSELGGGSFNGLVHLKLGDVPEARRIKMRTVVKGFDARRAGWEDDELRKFLKQSPLLESSADTFFKGVIFQRPILPPGAKKMPRTPVMQLLGADGALAVKRLTLNDVSFQNILSGSFSFSTSDFSMSLKEVHDKRGTEEKKLESTISKEVELPNEPPPSMPLDEISISASLKGEGMFRFRVGNAEIDASFSTDEQKRRIASLTTKNVLFQDIVGHRQELRDGDALGGAVNIDMNLDLTSRVGEGTIFVEDPRFGPLRFSSVGGKVLWDNQDFFLQEGRVNFRRSEYRIDARYGTQGPANKDFAWEVNIGILRADIRDVAELVRNGNSIATAMQGPEDHEKNGFRLSSSGPKWLHKLLQSYEDEENNEMFHWEVPQHLSLPEQVDWVCEYVEEQKILEKLERKKRKREPQPIDRDTNFYVGGDITGRVTLNYNSRSGDYRQGSSSGGALMQAILDQLTRTTFSFVLVGKDWRIGDLPMRTVSASGNYEDGVLVLGPFRFEGDDGFGAEASGRVTRAGAVDGSVIVRNAPALLIQKYSKAPVEVSGEWSGRLEVEGNLSNPRALGRMVWTDATLNGKHVRDARTDMACVNGRCVLNVDARIGTRRRSREQSDKERVASLYWEKNVSDELKDLASKASSKKVMAPSSSKRRKDDTRRKRAEDGLQLRISAPVRFYLLNYLQRRAPTSFWTEIEPVLGGSSPSDDEWILVNADVKKYGLILLNTIVPEIGWVGGNSDVKLRVSGSLQKPILSGHVSVLDGKLTPSVLEEPLQSVRGEMLINENGLLTLKSISGKCDGKAVTLNGDMFVSKEHILALEKEIAEKEGKINLLEASGNGQQKKKRQLMSKVNDEKLMLERGRKGVVAEFGEVPVNFQKVVVSKLSGRIVADGVLSDTSVGGWVTFSDGVVFVGSASSVSSSAPAGPSSTPEFLSVPKKVNSRALVDATSATSGNEPMSGDSESQPDKAGGPALTEGLGSNTEDEDEDVPSAGKVSLDRLKVSLGRKIKLVQPFVLDIEAAGSVTLHGKSVAPDIDGMIQLVKGKVNALALRLKLAKKERSFVKFIGREEWKRQGNDGEPEMLMRVVMENDSLVVRVEECKVTAWADNVSIFDKDRDMGSDRSSNKELFYKIDQTRSGETMKRFVINALLRMAEVGGKIGFFEWKLFPSLVTGDRSNNGDIKWKDEVGVGGRVELGGVSASAKKSVSGNIEGKLQLKLGKLAKIRIGTDGPKLSTELEIFPRPGSGEIDDEGVLTRPDHGSRRVQDGDHQDWNSANDEHGE